jgi:hypothetical protein
VACTAGVDVGPEIPRADPRPGHSIGPDGTITVDGLGLSFELPPSFDVAEEPDFVFLARSFSPPSVFSIDVDAPSVVEHEPEGGESVAPARIPGVDAVVVTDAALEGLQPGLEARELLVSNGDRSFTVIMSAPESEIASLWKVFISSVAVEPV